MTIDVEALTAALYVDSGVRGMERGVVSAGRDPKTGDHRYPKLELAPQDGLAFVANSRFTARRIR